LDATKDYMQLNWPKLKPQIRRHWSKITEDDMAKMNGTAEELINVLRKRYGYGKAQAEIEIDNWLLKQEDLSARANT
jgi:uncharacterized protein YjbJ (UPF0337 family)